MNNNFLLESYEDKISNYSQIGGIELATIRGGTGDGTQIAWFNTGSGLRFKVVIDYGLDIADAFINNMAWRGSAFRTCCVRDVYTQCIEEAIL